MLDINKMSSHSGEYVDEFSNKRNVIERVTGGFKQINSDHANIHKGEGFSISGIFASVAGGAVVNYAFKTPTVASGKYVHWKYRDLQATANKVRLDFYEAPTNPPTNGTDLTPINRNRNSETISLMQAIKTGMTLNLTGAKSIDTAQFISSSSRSLDIEFVLKPDTWYIVTLTNSTGAQADINFFEFWYEENDG